MRRLKHFYLLVGLLMMAAFACVGCSTEQYKLDADQEVYSIIDSKWQRPFGPKANYRIKGVPPGPNDLRTTPVSLPNSARLSLADAVALATARNREYQKRKEQLYLSALDLTLVRWQFARRWFGTIDVGYKRDGTDESVEAGGDLGLQQLLADGAQISTSIALDWARFLTGDPRTTLGSVLSASIRQPLLRGRGRRIVQENLTQAERDVLYQIRSFSRYRKSFVVSIVADYYRVLQQTDVVANALSSWRSKQQLTRRLQMEAEEGRTARYQVDQAKQSELNAEDSYLRALQSYQQKLDEFKIRLGLPTDADVVLDPNELKALQRMGIEQPNFTLEAAVEAALARRLDLANSADAVQDAARKVEVAADNLGMDLDLVASGRVDSTAKTELERLRLHEGNYSFGLEAQLPLDRKAERNAYRQALISLEQKIRDYENDIDQVKLQVRQAYRQLVEAAASYQTQKKSLELAEKRVEVSPLLWEAQRANTRDLLEAQDALQRARNSLTAALVDHTIAKLTFFRDIGVLQVKPDGMWEIGK